MALPPAEASALAQACLEHLNQERDRLTQLESIVASQHTALIRSDAQALTAVAAAQALLLESSDAHASARKLLRRRAAEFLGISPDQVTISRLAEYLPESAAAPLRAIQRDVREAAGRIRTFAERTQALAGYCNAFARGLLAAGSGEEFPTERYGPGGTRLAPDSAGAVSGVV